MSSYLFVLCPPYSGSTLLWKLLATSRNVSALPSEGQFLPELESIMRYKPWDPDVELPWPKIKILWESYWDKSKPILLEKSPPNLIRASKIQETFRPAKFIIMTRNPYAHTEGLMRRNGWNLGRAANFSITCLRAQLENIRALDESLVLSYEFLVAAPAQACDRIAGFVPELSDMDSAASFEVHSVDGTLDRPITDLNAKKIAALSAADITSMNEIFARHTDVLDAWEYALIAP